jgi:hypothetical protein
MVPDQYHPLLVLMQSCFSHPAPFHSSLPPPRYPYSLGFLAPIILLIVAAVQMCSNDDEYEDDDDEGAQEETKKSQ